MRTKTEVKKFFIDNPTIDYCVVETSEFRIDFVPRWNLKDCWSYRKLKNGNYTDRSSKGIAGLIRKHLNLKG